MVAHVSKGLERVELVPPAMLKPIQLWTGKQVFSMLLRPASKDRNILVNCRVPEKNFSGTRENMCPKDGLVEFRNSELISGGVGKKTLGDGAKNGLFARLVRDVTPEIATKMMGRVARVSCR